MPADEIAGEVVDGGDGDDTVSGYGRTVGGAGDDDVTGLVYVLEVPEAGLDGPVAFGGPGRDKVSGAVVSGGSGDDELVAGTYRGPERWRSAGRATMSSAAAGATTH